MIQVLTWVTGLDYQGRTGLLFHSAGKEEYVRNAGDPLQHLSGFSHHVIKVHGKLQQPDPSRITESQDS